ENGRAKLAAGTARIISKVTLAELDFNFAVLHAGGHNLHAGVCQAHDDFAGFARKTQADLSSSGPGSCARTLDNYFGDEVYTLKSLFRDERTRIVRQIVDSALADIDQLYSEVYAHNTALIGFLRGLSMPLPAILRVSSEFVLNNNIRRALAGAEIDLD